MSNALFSRPISQLLQRVGFNAILREELERRGKFDVAGNPYLKAREEYKGPEEQPQEDIPAPHVHKRRKSVDGEKRGPKIKLLFPNPDKSYDPVTLPGTFTCRSQRVVLFPCVALTRAMKFNPKVFVDAKLYEHEGKIGLLITTAMLKTSPKVGTFRKRVARVCRDSYLIPISRAHAKRLGFIYRDRLAIQLIPEPGREDYQPALFVYKGQGAEELIPPRKQRKPYWLRCREEFREKFLKL